MAENLEQTETEKPVSVKMQGQIKIRLWRTLNYLTIYVFIILVYSGFFFTEYILLHEVSLFLAEDVKEFPVVDTWFKNARIGLAFLIMLVAFVHGIIATYEQLRIDRSVSAEE